MDFAFAVAVLGLGTYLYIEIIRSSNCFSGDILSFGPAKSTGTK